MTRPSYRDKQNRYRTQSLFKEFYVGGKRGETYPPVFTLKEFDDGDLPSLRQLFLSYNDPTGYKFALDVLGSYEHWKKLCSLKWFNEDYLQSWLEELEIKLTSEGLKTINDVAAGDSAQAFNASKFLVSKGWTPTKGRPTKADIKKAAHIQAEVEDRVSDDLSRLKVVK